MKTNNSFFNSKHPIKLTIIGAHSSGKTTLSKALAQKLNIPLINGDYAKQLARTIFAKNRLADLNISEYWEMEYLYYSKQIVAESNIPEFISDGGVLLNPVYLSSAYPSNIENPAYIAFYKLCINYSKKSYTHVVYLPPEIPLENDGFRNQDPNYREKINSMVLEILTKENFKFIIATGSVNDRIMKIENNL